MSAHKEPSCAIVIRSVSLQERTLIRLPSLSENACRRIAIPGQVSPLPTLTFVLHSREKAEVGRKFLSENLYCGKLGEKR
jgi:hypothetical protein